jgi:2-amino-4-hydroxy-6-hydroxymethyldihydropteridine diphosphokinase
VDDDERIRWVAAGWLHDSLKDKKTKKLRKMVSKETRKSLPAPVLHGPAAAAKLREEGVEDEELLVAVEHHTLGHPDFGSTGLALYAADFLEPGRTARKKWRSRLRNDMPDSVHDVVARIVRDRMTFLLQRGRMLHPQTVAFWNRLMREPR